MRVIVTMGGVYYALPEGSKIVELAFPILSPNGCGLSPDGTMLYVADTEGARLWAFDVEAPGVLRALEPFRPHSGRVIAGLPGNARFGGPDMCTAYITLSDTGRLGMMQWPEPGLKLHFG